jgi:prevent-host-death family protein
MRVTLTEAKGQLAELARRAEAGEEVVLTRHGHPAVKLVPAAAPRPTAAEKAAIIEAIQKRVVKKAKLGPCAARSQDYLYDAHGLPK